MIRLVGRLVLSLLLVGMLPLFLFTGQIPLWRNMWDSNWQD